MISSARGTCTYKVRLWPSDASANVAANTTSDTTVGHTVRRAVHQCTAATTASSPVCSAVQHSSDSAHNSAVLPLVVQGIACANFDPGRYDDLNTRPRPAGGAQPVLAASRYPHLPSLGPIQLCRASRSWMSSRTVPAASGARSWFDQMTTPSGRVRRLLSRYSRRTPCRALDESSGCAGATSAGSGQRCSITTRYRSGSVVAISPPVARAEPVITSAQMPATSNRRRSARRSGVLIRIGGVDADAG